MRYIFLLLLNLFVYSSYADTIKVQDLSLEYKNFSKSSHNPLVTENGLNHKMGQEVSLYMNIDFLGPIYWNNRVHSYTDRSLDGGRGAFRVVGWEYQLGMRITPWLDVGYYHHSQHLLDATLPFHTPGEDSLGLRIYFIIPTKDRDSIL